MSLDVRNTGMAEQLDVLRTEMMQAWKYKIIE